MRDHISSWHRIPSPHRLEPYPGRGWWNPRELPQGRGKRLQSPLRAPHAGNEPGPHTPVPPLCWGTAFPHPITGGAGQADGVLWDGDLLVQGPLAFGSPAPNASLVRHSLSYEWMLLLLLTAGTALGRCWSTRRKKSSPTQLTQC